MGFGSRENKKKLFWLVQKKIKTLLIEEGRSYEAAIGGKTGLIVADRCQKRAEGKGSGFCVLPHSVGGGRSARGKERPKLKLRVELRVVEEARRLAVFRLLPAEEVLCDLEMKGNSFCDLRRLDWSAGEWEVISALISVMSGFLCETAQPHLTIILARVLVWVERKIVVDKLMWESFNFSG